MQHRKRTALIAGPTPEKTGTTALIPISEMTQTAMAMPAEDCLQLARKTAIRIN